MKVQRGKRSFLTRGQSLFIVIVALPAIIGSLALVVDIGNLYYNKLCMQTAMDSGVLAGALYLPSDPSQAESVAKNYAILNGLKGDEITSVSVTPDDKAVTMTSSRKIPCYFCAVLGEGTAYAATSASSSSGWGGLQASATALIEPIRSARGVVPIGLDSRTSVSYGTEVHLKAGQLGPGNWGPLALGANGADNYENNVQNGYPGTLSIGDWPETETGNITGPTEAAIDNRISIGQNQYSTGTFEHHNLGDPRVMLIPIVDYADDNGKSPVPVVGFAAVWVVSVDGQGDITCYFIQQSMPDAQPDPNASSAGATAPALVN
jgi:Putative Flp pilus-assembly TadE/G-like